jgi:pimeloyl-ACP methyl ester carboxylesterase
LRYGRTVLSQVLSAAVTRASAAVDQGALRRIEAQMRRVPPPRGNRAHVRDRLEALAQLYSNGTLGADSPFFPAPCEVEIRERRLGDGPEGCRVSDLSFSSEYRPFNADYREEHARWRENLTAHTRVYSGPRSRGRARPAIVLIHGWGGGNFWLEERAFTVGRWLRAGLDVAVFQLPFHGHRAPAVPGATRSGTLFLGPHFVRTNEAFGQAVWDLRTLADFLRMRGAPSVGVFGMSLGGYTAALWTSVDPTLAFSTVMIPPVSIAELMWKHGEDSPTRREAMKAGVTLELVDELFAVHSPLTRAPRLPSERLLVIAGKGDQICPPDHAERLARHWRSDMRYFPGGHLAQVGRADAFRVALQRIHDLDLTGES